ncbi:hypothetical protein BH11MYX3_BH11MYX3_45500 [soil metagenome]
MEGAGEHDAVLERIAELEARIEVERAAASDVEHTLAEAIARRDRLLAKPPVEDDADGRFWNSVIVIGLAVIFAVVVALLLLAQPRGR